MEEAEKVTKHLNNLIEYIENDPMFQAYEEGKEIEDMSDFDEFCLNHCIDISVAVDVLNFLIECNKRLEKEKNALTEALVLVKQKKNSDKARYRRKAKVLRNRINDVVADIDRQIESCTAEAEGTVNNEHCWMAVNYLKKVRERLLDKGE